MKNVGKWKTVMQCPADDCLAIPLKYTCRNLPANNINNTVKNYCFV